MIEVIVFDIGGVIIRTFDRTGRYELEKKYGLSPGGSDELVFNSKPAQDSTIGLVGQDQIWINVKNQLDLSVSELEEFKNKFWQGDKVDQDLIDFIVNLRQSYKTALLTNAWCGARENFKEHYQLIEDTTVDKFLISSELGVAKPNLRIYQILGETVNTAFDKILFIDDFIENIHAANQLGIQTIHFRPEMDLISQIKSKLKHD